MYGKWPGLWVCLTVMAFFLCPSVALAKPAAFGMQDVETLARNLSAAPFVDNKGQIPAVLKSISYDDWRDIRFVPDKSLSSTVCPFPTSMGR